MGHAAGQGPDAAFGRRQAHFGPPVAPASSPGGLQLPRSLAKRERALYSIGSRSDGTPPPTG